MTTELRVLRFEGIHSDTLGHYLTALGLLAAIARRWPDIRDVGVRGDSCC